MHPILVNTLSPPNIHNPHPLLHSPECLLVQNTMRLRRMRTCQHHTIRYCQRSFQRTMIHRTTQRHLKTYTLPRSQKVMYLHPHRQRPKRNLLPNPHNAQDAIAQRVRIRHHIALNFKVPRAAQFEQPTLAERRVQERGK
ncbi:predicted protein [Histoplasma capsulatum var. duboisii H88]|uniref:Predicted protein n=1 Tax=Ajellomyces capsulatus (strain H88) TaxID=544711 RepID=F0UPF9_AJEC8|nr:predicted protein [Histoplasma capsulatum var. duboisii H88]